MIKEHESKNTLLWLCYNIEWKYVEPATNVLLRQVKTAKAHSG